MKSKNKKINRKIRRTSKNNLKNIKIFALIALILIGAGIIGLLIVFNSMNITGNAVNIEKNIEKAVNPVSYLTGFIVSSAEEQTIENFSSEKANLEIKEPEKFLGNTVSKNKNKRMDFQTINGNIRLYFDLLNYSEFIENIGEIISNETNLTINITTSNINEEINEEINNNSDKKLIVNETNNNKDQEVIDNVTGEQTGYGLTGFFIKYFNNFLVLTARVVGVEEEIIQTNEIIATKVSLDQVKNKVEELSTTNKTRLEEIEDKSKVELEGNEFEININETASSALGAETETNPDYKWGYKVELKDLKFMARIQVTSDKDISKYDEYSLRIGRNLLSFKDLVDAGYKVRVEAPILGIKANINVKNMNITNIFNETKINETIVNVTEIIVNETNITSIILNETNISEEIINESEEMISSFNETEENVEQPISEENVNEESEEVISNKSEENDEDQDVDNGIIEPVEEEQVVEEQEDVDYGEPGITGNIIRIFSIPFKFIMSMTGKVIVNKEVDDIKYENSITIYVERDFNEVNNEIIEFNNQENENTGYGYEIKNRLIELGIDDLDKDGMVSVGDVINLDPSLIILIIKAEHLNKKRKFISDIYDYVKTKDNNWSEEIKNKEYVRVTFEENLTKNSDITVYARATTGSAASIEVYREGEDDLIAVIENITEEAWYKTYLTNLNEGESRDVFDLKINKKLELDYIVDPQANESSTVFQCGTLDSPGTYTMNQSIINNTLLTPCINITSQNITLNCNGFSIKSDDAQAGIYSNQRNTTIKNCNISMNAGPGGHGIFFSNGANYSFIYNVTDSSTHFGFYIDNSSDVLIQDSNFSASISGVEVSGASMNITCLNCSYSPSQEIVLGGSELIRRWYYQAYVNDTSGNPVGSASILAYNRTGTLIGNFTTNSSGWIGKDSLIEYVNTNNYYSNYAINVTKSGYTTGNYTYNVSLNLNKLDNVYTLNASLCPNSWSGSGTSGNPCQVTECNNISVANLFYKLQNNVSIVGTCFNITANNITLNGNGKTISYNSGGGDNQYGIFITGGNRDNITILNCNIVNGTVGGNGGSGIYFYAGVNNSLILNNTILIDYSLSDGISLGTFSNSNILNNTINSYNGIYISGTSNNIQIIGNNLSSTGASSGIYLSSSFDSVISKNIFNHCDATCFRISDSASASNISFIDQNIHSGYIFSSNSSNFRFENTSFGSIYFSNINSASGNNLIGNLTSEIIIRNNSVYVNSSVSGLNKSANITLYGINDRGFLMPVIYRDGTNVCNSTTNPSCWNFTALNSSTVIFNVSSWSNYSIGEGAAEVCPNSWSGSGISGDPCQVTECNNISVANLFYKLQNNVSTVGTCFNISTNNVNLDFNGKNITGGGSYLGDDYGVYVKDYNFTIIKNGGIYGFSKGIYLLNNKENNIINITSSLNAYGFYIISSNNQIINCTLNDNYDVLHGEGRSIYINSNNNTLKNIIIDSINVEHLPDGIYINSGSDNYLENITILNSKEGVYLLSSSNNTIINFTINSSGNNAILISGASSSNNNFTNIIINNTGVGYYDLRFSDAGINGTYFIDMPHIGNYSISSGGALINIKDSTYGVISFISSVNGSGTNFTNDIRIGNNSVTVEAGTQIGLNKSANITLYGINDRGFITPVILRNGVNVCNTTTSPSCWNFTALNASTVIFNVSSWSNYSIGEGAVEVCPNSWSGSGTSENPCQVTECNNISVANLFYVLQGNITGINGTCFTISADNITLNGNGYNITGNSSGYGINASSLTGDSPTNLTIKNIKVYNFSQGFYSIAGSSNDNGYDVGIISFINSTLESIRTFGGTGDLDNNNSGNGGIGGNITIVNSNISVLNLTGGDGYNGAEAGTILINSSKNISYIGVFGGNGDASGGSGGSGGSGYIIIDSSNLSVILKMYGGIDAVGRTPGTLTILNSNISGTINLIPGTDGATIGGKGATVYINNSLIQTSINSDGGNGGGGTSGNGGSVTIFNSTIIGNISSNGGPGVGGSGGMVIVTNSIISSGVFSDGSVFGNGGNIVIINSNISDVISSKGGNSGNGGNLNISGDILNIQNLIIKLTNGSGSSSPGTLILNYTASFNDTNTTYVESSGGILLKILRTGYGKVDWRNYIVSTSLTNISQSIVIGNNSVYLDSGSRTELNISANITLYGINDRGFTIPVILRNGVNVCNTTTSPSCWNFTALNASTVIFNISSWSNYSIGEGGIITPIWNQSSENSTDWWMFRKYLNHTAWDVVGYSGLIGANMTNFSTGGDVRSSPAVANGYVYIGSADYQVYQLNASNISQKIANFSTGGTVYSSPAVANGYVYIGSTTDYNVYQLNASNVSQQIANFTAGAYVFSSPAVANGYVYIGSFDNNVYQLNASNISQKIANFSTGGEIDSSPAVANGYVYVGSRDNNVYQLNVSNVSQKIANFSTQGWIYSSPAVVNGYVYVGSDDYQVYQLNASNVSQKIANFSTGNLVESSPAVANGYVYIGSFDNNVYQLNASNISQKIANFTTGGDVYSSPAVANGYVYIGSNDNNVYQLNASNISQKIANFTTGNEVYSSPAVANGYVYIGSYDNNVYQLNASNISLGNSGATPDTIYPLFSTYYDNNATLIDTGTGWFNVTLLNTNGTVLLEINNTNITAINLTANVYNVSYTFATNGTYAYRWWAYGNGTNELLNRSDEQSYTVNNSAAVYPTFSNYYDNNATLIGSGLGVFNVTLKDTNGTVWLDINNTNITAWNMTSSVYNVSYTFATNETYAYRWWAYGNGTNKLLNRSDERSYTVNESVDTAPPSFTFIPNGINQSYPQNFNVTFTATDDIGLGYYSINWTTLFAINQSGTLNNTARLGVGNYYINVTINDTAGNKNSTIFNINITQNNSYVISLAVTPTTTVVYPIETTATGSNCPADLICNLTLNSTGGFVANPHTITLGVGIYNYTFNTSGNANYSSASVSKILTINKGILNGSLINNTARVLIYPNPFNFSFVETNIGDSDLTYSVYRNGTDVTNENGTNVVLGVGTYNYVLNSSGGKNYTTNNSISNFSVTVNINSSAVVFTYLNNTRANITTSNNSQVWLNATLFNVTGVVSIYNDGVLVGSNTSRIGNLTNFNVTGIFNITSIYAGNENYSRASETWYVNVSYVSPLANKYPTFTTPTVTPINDTIYAPDRVYEFNITILDTNSTSGIEFNGINYTVTNLSVSVYNFTIKDLSRGYYQYYFWSYGNGTSTYFNTSIIYGYTIAQNTTATVYTYLNNTRANITTNNNSQVWLNGTMFNVTGIVYLYKNGTFVGSNTSRIGNLTNFNNTGIYNITAIYLGDNNYSRSYETWYVNVSYVAPLADNYPTFSTYYDNNATFIGSGLGLFNITLKDTNGTVWLDINFTNLTATNLSASVYNVSYTFATNATYAYRWWAYGNGTNKLLNQSDEQSYIVNNTPAVYPTFSTYYDNNATLIENGTGLFNVTLLNTNGTVWLDINNMNITSWNMTSGVYNVSYTFTTNSTYAYRWWAYGNGTSNKILNRSDEQSYTVNASLYPNIMIVSPSNNTNTTNTGLDVNYTYSDDVAVDRCWWTNNSGVSNYSLVSCENITNITWGDGLQNIIVYINDSNGNKNSSSVRFRIDTTPPVFDNLRNFSLQVNTSSFAQAITATDAGIGLQTYKLNDTSVFSVDVYGAITNVTGLTSVSIYYLNLSVNDSLNNLKSGVFYINITTDIAVPSITLVSPADAISYTSTSQSISFQYNVSDVSNVDNCSLFVNGTLKITNSTVNKSVANNFTSSFGVGNYNWSVNCTDSFNNIGNSSKRSFSVTTPTSESPGGGGGGGGGGTISVKKGGLIISYDDLNIKISREGVKTKKIEIYNNGSSVASVKINISGAKEIFDISDEDLFFSLDAGGKRVVTIRIFAPDKLGIYTGKILINNEELLFNLNVETEEVLFDVKVDILDDYKFINRNDKIISKISLSPIGDLKEDVILNYTIKDYKGNIYYSETKTILVSGHKEFVEEFSTVGLAPGKYILGLELKYSKGVASSTSQFSVREEVSKIFKNKIVIYSILAGGIAIVLVYFLVKKLFWRKKKPRKKLKRKK